MFGMFGGGFGGGSFDANYRVYPVSFIDKPEAENGDKIFLPPSALDRLSSLHIDYPMLFRVASRATGRFSHCGVLEFIADEGMVYLPYWMMQNLALTEGDILNVKSATLPKGTYVKLQPHTKDFLDISNPKAVLETTLRGYACLTKGDAICVHYNNKRYYIDIVEAKPADAITVIETDCEVDFAPPLDYVEPAREESSAAAGLEAMEDGAAGPSDAAAEPEEPLFSAFTGQGRRLDGKPATSPTQPPAGSAAGPSSSASSAGAAGAVAAARAGGGAGTSNGTAAAGGKPKPAGKRMFAGGNRLLAAQQQKAHGGQQPSPPKPKEEPTTEEDKWKAFTGKPNKLK